jgi:putative redox protein
MPTEKLTFKGHDGNALAARLDTPDGPHHATAIFAHCFTCSKDIPAARRIAQSLAALGIATLRFDFTGLGHSGGEFANTNFSSNVDDLIAAAAHLESIDMAPDMIIGHSLGGAAVLKAAPQIASAKAVVTIGAPHDPEHVLHNFNYNLDTIRKDGAATVTLAGREFTIRRDFLEDVAATSLDTAIGSMKKALLVLHSPIDATVGIENAGQIFAAAKHPKSFVTLDDADHLVTRATDADYAAQVIAGWSAKYLPKPVVQDPSKPAEGTLRVSEADPGGFLQHVTAGRGHHTLADEPKSFGGTDKGFTPYEFVSAGLGACTSMTLRMYARHKGWPLDHVYVDVSHNKIHATDCAHCETEDGKIDRFTRAIHIEGDLSDEQHARLMEIADRCPVHRTLEAEIDIETVAAE